MDLANPAAFRPTLLAARHMVCAGHPLAAMAGMRVLEAGGNAVDAGVAAGFALNVVQPDMANLGGVAPIVIHEPNGRVTTIAGVGTWPQAATRAAVAAAGQGRIPAGPPRWVVPAAVDAWLTALARYGTWSAGDILSPATALADHGFPANDFLRHNLGIVRERRREAAHTRAVFLPNGAVPANGALVVQPHLADTLRRLADAERATTGTREQGIRAARDAFYRGEIAARIGAFSREIGAFITEADLHNYAVEECAPVSVQYRGRTLFCAGPWSQAPALAQMLRVLDGLDLAAMDAAERAHTLIETVRLCLRDRNAHYGDPDFVDVPLGHLLSDGHASDLRGRVRERAFDAPPPQVMAPASPDTTYVCVVDAEGRAFSASPSDSTILVSPMIPDLGFGISDRGLQASLDPADPNVIAPGKRPRLTPSPALLADAEGVMPFGTPGGEVQLQAMVQFLVNHIDLGMDLQPAIEAPRWASFDVPATEDPHPAQPKLVRLESRAPEALAAGLRARGHDVQPWPELAALAGAICAIRRDARSGVLRGGADPRRMSWAIGW
jgi:gamma-glutamyltranspeptidase / glutathione hydrolase